MANWVILEKLVRNVLSGYFEKQFNEGVELSDASNALELISNIFGNETGRGYEYEDAKEKSEEVEDV